MIKMDISVARKYIEKLYLDRCDIYEYQKVVDPDDHTTSNKEVLVHEDVPCKLSTKTKTTTDDGIVDDQYQAVSLILNPDITVKAGSRVVVRRGDCSISYKNSGTPSMCFNHQEILLVVEEDKA